MTNVRYRCLFFGMLLSMITFSCCKNDEECEVDFMSNRCIPLTEQINIGSTSQDTFYNTIENCRLKKRIRGNYERILTWEGDKIGSVLVTSLLNGDIYNSKYYYSEELLTHMDIIYEVGYYNPDYVKRDSLFYNELGQLKCVKSYLRENETSTVEKLYSIRVIEYKDDWIQDERMSYFKNGLGEETTGLRRDKYYEFTNKRNPYYKMYFPNELVLAEMEFLPEKVGSGTLDFAYRCMQIADLPVNEQGYIDADGFTYECF